MNPAPVKAIVGREALDALDIRVGTVLGIGDIPGSAKLAQLRVDFGDDQRTIVVGMTGEREHPEEIAGAQALFVVNVAPRRMAGVVSEGTLFDIGHADGVVPVLATPERPVPSAARAG